MMPKGMPEPYRLHTQEEGELHNSLSKMHGEMFELAKSYRDTACRTLDKAERYAKQGKPLPPDEIAAMTARIAEDDKKLYGEPRQVPPHTTGPAGVYPPPSHCGGQEKL